MLKEIPSVFSETNVVRGLLNLVQKVPGGENSWRKDFYTQLTALHRHEEKKNSWDNDSRRKKKTAEGHEVHHHLSISFRSTSKFA